MVTTSNPAFGRTACEDTRRLGSWSGIAPDVEGCVLQDRYEVGQLLDEGGMSWVYEAHDRRGILPLLVVKIAGRHSEHWLTFVQREAALLSRFDHPRIVRAHGHGFVRDHHYLLMTRLSGESLGSYMKNGHLTLADAVRAGSEVLEGVDTMHSAGVIHRDIKPSNVIRTPEGCVLIDFGLAWSSDDDPLNSLGLVSGTPCYMSPEQCVGLRAPHPSSDIYSCGVMLYELLTGTKPFHADDPKQVMSAHCAKAPPPFRMTAPHLAGSPLEAVTMQALAKDPEDRPPSASAMRQSLLAALTSP